jgi:MFS family permease
MSEEPKPPESSKSDYDYGLLLPFLAHVALLQTMILIVRVTTSYRALELGLPVFWLGVIAAGFAIIPVFSAVKLGRWIDRGFDAQAIRIGNVLILAACIGLWLWPSSALHLVGLSVLLGFGHMFCMAGHQMLMVRAGGPLSRENVLGYYMIAAAIGQGAGPLVVGWIGGSASLPPTGTLFAISLGIAAVSLVVALIIRKAAVAAGSGKDTALVPIRALLHTRGLPAIFIASVVTVTALDLLVIYMPALGAERHIDATNIGLLLTVRSAASLVSRVFYSRLIFAVGRAPLTLVSMLVSAAAFGALAMPLSLPAMYAVMVVLGFGMGIASTLTLSGVVYLAPPGSYGTALTLRMTGNRLGQVVFPAAAGLVAAAVGVAGIFIIIGLGIGVSGIAVPLSLRSIGGSPDA